MSEKSKPQSQNQQEAQVPPSPSLLYRMKDYWKKNLPEAYKEMKEEDFEKAVSQAQEQLGILVEHGLSLSGAGEIVYPDLFPDPENPYGLNDEAEEEAEDTDGISVEGMKPVGTVIAGPTVWDRDIVRVVVVSPGKVGPERWVDGKGWTAGGDPAAPALGRDLSPEEIADLEAGKPVSRKVGT